MCLLLFALYFSMAEVRTWRREGCVRAVRPGAWARWLLVALTVSTALVHLAQLGTADRQWTRFLRSRPHHFTSFDLVAQLSAVARGLAASLLFLLWVKVRHRLVCVGLGTALRPGTDWPLLVSLGCPAAAVCASVVCFQQDIVQGPARACGGHPGPGCAWCGLCPAGCSGR